MGCAIRCDFGHVYIGKNFSANKNFLLNSEDEIRIGDNCLCGVNVNFRDSDGHSIIENGIRKENKNKVFVGNNCWICSYVDILKGSKIGNNCVIGLRSIVTKKIDGDNCLILGFPAKKVKDNIKWEK